MLICSKDVRHEHNTIVNLVAVLEVEKKVDAQVQFVRKRTPTCEGKYLKMAEEILAAGNWKFAYYSC
jgi:hypothetical protein